MRSLALALVLAALPGARAEAKGCTEHSDVVGLQHCGHFGTWSRDDDVPRLWLEVGYIHHAYRSDPFTLAPGIAAMGAATSSFPTDAYGGVIRMLGGLGHVFYVGGEFAIGGASVHAALDPPPDFSTYFAPHVIAGAHVDLVRIGFSIELAAGFRHESFESCPTSGCIAVDVYEDRRMLEARVGADLFLARHWSVGVKLGKSLIDDNDSSLVISTAFHLRAMDGM